VLLFADNSAVQEIFAGHGFTTVPFIAVSAMNMKRENKM
jgi:hypothetical protein